MQLSSQSGNNKYLKMEADKRRRIIIASAAFIIYAVSLLKKERNIKKLNDEEDSDMEYEDIVDLHLEQENDIVNPSLENPARDSLTTPSSASRTISQKKRKISEGQELNSKIDSTYLILKDAMNGSVQQKDECALYGELLAIRLRDMDLNTRNDCMQEMDAVYNNIKKRSTSFQHPIEKIQQQNSQQP